MLAHFSLLAGSNWLAFSQMLTFKLVLSALWKAMHLNCCHAPPLSGEHGRAPHGGCFVHKPGRTVIDLPPFTPSLVPRLQTQSMQLLAQCYRPWDWGQPGPSWRSPAGCPFKLRVGGEHACSLSGSGSGRVLFCLLLPCLFHAVPFRALKSLEKITEEGPSVLESAAGAASLSFCLTEYPGLGLPGETGRTIEVLTHSEPPFPCLVSGFSNTDLIIFGIINEIIVTAPSRHMEL